MDNQKAAYEIKEIPWKNCKDICDILYKNNELLTPYQEYEFLDIVGIGRKETNPFCTFGYLGITYVVFKNFHEIAVLPLYVNNKKKTILLRGYFSIIAHLDIIYSINIKKEDFQYIFDSLKKKYSGYTLIMDRISEKSYTYKYLLDRGNIDDSMKSICVSINFSDGYDAWFSSLKKSFKQDVRSGYNRLKTDGKDYRFEFDKFASPTNIACQDMLRLYSRRACEHSGIKSGLKSSVIQKYLQITKKNNPFNKALEHSDRYIGGRIYINDNIAAYCQGLLSNDGRIIVPKLSINLDYKRYNLGGLLISEMIKHAVEDIGLNMCYELDLSRGDERYKYDYGGMEHFNYNVTIAL